MKKNAAQLTLAVLILLCGNSYAQKITVGLKGGLSIPNLTGGGSETPLNAGYSSRMGADGGIYAEYHVTKPFSVSLGLEYSSQGGLKNNLKGAPQAIPNIQPPPTYLYANIKSEAILDYILVPVLARYTWKVNKRSPVRIYAAFGPFAGFLLNAHQKTSGTSAIFLDPAGQTPIAQPVSFDKTTSIKDSLNTLNVGICGMVGISYSFNKKHTIFIEGGGNYGFMSIQKGSANGKNNTGAGVITIGYAYTLQSKYRRRGM